MKSSNRVVWLSVLITVLALAAASIGLFYQDGGHTFSFTTLRGEMMHLYGQGLYRYDTPITAIGFRAADAITLVLAIPLLLFSLVLYRRGSLKGGLLLTGVLAYFLYTYGSMAIGAAYNNLFLVYTAILSASFFAFVLALTSFEVQALPSHVSTRLPRRAMSIFLIVSGGILIFVWLVLSIVPALFQGKAPVEVASYTTFITGAIDTGIVGPALIVVGTLLLQRVSIGYLLAAMMLVFTVILGMSLIAAGITQVVIGVISIGQAMGFTAPFALLTLIAIWFTVAFFRSFEMGPSHLVLHTL